MRCLSKYPSLNETLLTPKMFGKLVDALPSLGLVVVNGQLFLGAANGKDVVMSNSAGSKLLEKSLLQSRCEVQSLCQVKRKQALQGCNHAEGYLGALIGTITASARISFPAPLRTRIGSVDPHPLAPRLKDGI